MAYAKIVDGVVTGAWLWPDDQVPAGLVACPDDVGPGWTYDGQVFSPPASGSPSLEDRRLSSYLSRRDFCLAAMSAGILSEADAIEAARGGWPASFASAVPAGQETAAQIIWASVSRIDRMDPLLLQVALAQNITVEALDTMFGIGD